MGSFFFFGIITFVMSFILVPMAIWAFKVIIPFDIVQENECHLYVMFGKVIAKVSDPGFVYLPGIMGVTAWEYAIFGKCHVVDLSWDQHYLRSLPVNSEEGAPMGIGVWYEMKVSDAVAYLYNNSDPQGSLRANVSNATVRCLSNLSLADMMETRHQMSRTVRGEVSPHSHEWGYRLGSVYIRKVHFRDRAMMRQIEEKVVNRLRQVTAAITQDGANQVNLIRSGADRQAAVAFAKAAAIRPEVVGNALREISQDKEVAEALFAVLENEKLLAGSANIIMLPHGMDHSLISSLVASKEVMEPAVATPVPMASSPVDDEVSNAMERLRRKAAAKEDEDYDTSDGFLEWE